LTAWLGAARDPELRDSLLGLRENPLRYIYEIERQPREGRKGYYFDKLYALSQCDYRSRAWIVQEFLLAKEVQLVYGDVRIDPAPIVRLISSQSMNDQVLARMHLDREFAVYAKLYSKVVGIRLALGAAEYRLYYPRGTTGVLTVYASDICQSRNNHQAACLT
jgi:hypothetical protein